MNDNNTQIVIEKLIEQYGEEKTNKLISYMDEILIKNEHINLTAVRDRNEAIHKHITDSLSCTTLPEYQCAKKIADMGTGGGFPGVPLATVSEDKEFTLVDALNKRLKVIDELTQGLGITNVHTLHSRAEDMGKSKEHREQYDLCVSRAVASLDVLVEWCLPLVKIGGYMIAYKGENVSRETSDAKKAIEALGGRVERLVEIDASSEDISGHVLLVIKKVKKTPSKYPRQAGQAKKNPIR